MVTNPFSIFSDLNDKISNRTARVMTVGLGYVGLPMALNIHESGFDTWGLDINSTRVASINAGERVISYFSENRIADAVASGRFRATDNPADIAEMDVILVCVPTPLDMHAQPDLTYLERAVRMIAEHVRPGQLVVLESTVWPGATANVVAPILSQGGLKIGRDIFLGFSPEREDPGRETHTTRTIPKVIGADDPHSRELLTNFYGHIVDTPVPVSSTATAEAVKLAENSFRTVNIALVNEMKTAFEAMGVDVWEVVTAAATKPFGYMPFYPGPGIGGDCIPVSPAYLSWRARDVGSETPIIDLARGNNESAPQTIADKILAHITRLTNVKPAEARVLIVGVSYKKDVEDTRVSPSLNAILALESRGAVADYHDPFFPVLPMTRDHAELAGRKSVDLTAETLAAYDAVAVLTDHSAVDYALIADSGRIVLDARNAFAARGIAPGPSGIIKI